MNQRLAAEQSRERVMRAGPEAVSCCFHEMRRCAMGRDRPEAVAVISHQRAELCAAQGMRLLQYRVEYRRQIAGRGIDDPQHLGGRGLLLQGLLRLGDQPRVFHRDDRLRREVLQQRNLLVGERINLLAVDRDQAEKRVLFTKRNHELGSGAADLSELTKPLMPIRSVLLDVSKQDETLPGCDPLERGSWSRRYRTALSYPLRKAGLAVQRDGGKKSTIIGPQMPMNRSAKAHCLFEHRIEYR